MDILHFSPDINHYICDSMIKGERQIDKSNYKENISKMKSLSNEIVEELVRPCRGDQILNAASFKKQGYSYVLKEEELTNDSLMER